jgi:hypothetical protein
MTTISSARGRVRTRMTAIGLASVLALPVMAPASAAAADPGFLPYQAIAVPSEPDAITIGDVTGDGRSDIVVTTGYSNDPLNDFHLVVLAQGANGTLLPPVLYATAGSYTARPGSVAIGDIDGDGRADVVVGLDRYGVQVFPQQADGTLGTPTIALSEDSTRVRVGVLDKSGRDQVAGIGWGTGTITQFADTGAGFVVARTYAARHDGYDDLEIADVTGDGKSDLIVMSGQGLVPNLSVLAALDSGTFGAAAEYSVGGSVLTHGIGVGDVTGDGRKDVVASYGGNKPSSFIGVFAQTAGGTLASPTNVASYDIPEPVEVADLDLDGRADVVTLHGGWQRAGVYRGRADGTLTSEMLYLIPYASHYNPHGLAIGDVNGDGWPDIVAADYNNGVIVLRNNGLAATSVPAAPTLTSAVAGNGRVALAWTAPWSDGGSPITSYTATASPGGATCSINGLGCAIGGLTNEVTYSFTVAATNSVGTGPVSNALSARPGEAPSAPQSLATSPNLAAGIGLSWQAPLSSGSSSVSGYRIYRGTTSGTASLLATVGNVLSFTDTAAANGGQYVYQVAAVNGFGQGLRSTEAAAQRGTAPSAPQAVSATTGGQGITVRWSSPAANGGSPITSYRIYRGTASGSETLLASVGPDITNYLDKSVGRKTRYLYRVTAVNVLGESVPSNEVTATSH